MIKHIILGFILLHTSNTLFCSSLQNMVDAASAGISAATILFELKNNKPSTSAKGNYQCLHCSRIFHKLCSFRNHQKVHQLKNIHTCNGCGAKYRNHQLLINHQGGIGKQAPCPVIKKTLAPLLEAVTAAQADQ